MLSILVRQQQLLQASFSQRYAHGWLVWEPGPWRPARSAHEANASATQLDEARGPARPTGMDAVCFALQPPATPGALVIGRESTSDVVVNDLTFSRHALLLFHAAQGWSAELHPEAHGELKLDGVAMRPRVHMPLASGSALSSGEVTLRYYDAQSIVERLSQSA